MYVFIYIYKYIFINIKHSFFDLLLYEHQRFKNIQKWNDYRRIYNDVVKAIRSRWNVHHVLRKAPRLYFPTTCTQVNKSVLAGSQNVSMVQTCLRQIAKIVSLVSGYSYKWIRLYKNKPGSGTKVNPIRIRFNEEICWHIRWKKSKDKLS